MADPQKKEPDVTKSEEGKDKPYPKSVFFIIGNEFCERFTYYGIRTVLTIYLSTILLYNEEDTKSIYHTFTMACYFTPLLGAIIADSWLGKFKTILYISIIYAIGNLVLSMGAFNFGLHTQVILSLLGLGLIAVGTGGIKPCVAAFGGDQFLPGQKVYLAQFFSVFYVCINAGSVLSTAITPYLRAIHCNGKDTCFPLAFGVPAALMVVSLALFLMGSRFYRMSPPGENVIVKLGGCVYRAVGNKFFRRSDESKENWLDHADDKYDQKFIDEVKAVFRVMVIFIPVPIFWALFDQQGSSWTLQATRMHWKAFGLQVLPDQIQLLNPLFILILAPLFGYVIYPLLQKCGLLTKPLQKMIVGGVLAGASFIVCMFLQIAVEAQDSNAMTLINTVPCALRVSYVVKEKPQEVEMPANVAFLKINRPFPSEIVFHPLCPNFTNWTYHPDVSHRSTREKLINVENEQLTIIDIPELGKGNVVDLKLLIRDDLSWHLPEVEDQSGNLFNFSRIDKVKLEGLDLYRIEFSPKDNITYTIKVDNVSCELQKMEVGEGYTYILSPNDTCAGSTTLMMPTLSLLWQAPQYILITMGEVLFSVTGLEFSYSQAPKSMKSVLQAAWLMTVAIGNLLVVIVAKIGLEKQSIEFLVFGLAMLGDMVFFAILAYFYKPLKPQPDVTSDNEMLTETTPLFKNMKGKRN